MAIRTDWTALWVGIGVALMSGCALILWPAEIFVWLGLLVGAVITGSALAHKVGGLYVNLLGGAAGAIIIVLLWIFVSHETPPPGPHFEFQGLKVNKDVADGRLTIEVVNTSDVAATSYFLAGKIFPSKSPDDIQNRDIQNAISEAEAAAKNYDLAPMPQMQITRGFGISLPVSDAAEEIRQYITQSDWKYYVVLVAIYSNTKAPIKRIWVTKTCARLVKPFTLFEACHWYNEYYYADRNLTPIN